jgi:hypothetical protein
MTIHAPAGSAHSALRPGRRAINLGGESHKWKAGAIRSRSTTIP